MSTYEHPKPLRAATADLAPVEDSDLGTLPRWNLADLYASVDDPAIDADLDWAAEQARSLSETVKGRMAGMSPAELAKTIAWYEGIYERLGKLGTFAFLNGATQRTDGAAMQFQAKINERSTNISSDLVFFSLELNAIDDSTMAQTLEDPAMAPWKSFVQRTRLMKPHQLSDELETFTHDFAIVGGNAWVQLFDETMAALSFDVDGKELSNAETFNLLADPDRATRAKAATAITKTLGENQRLMTRINNTVIKQKELDDKWRGYERPVSSRNVANEVEDEVVKALADTVTEAFPRISHRYYAMKAKWLGLETMEPYDRNAPLPEADEAKIPWQEAKNRVLDAYAGFTPSMAAIAGDFFDKGWIDSPVIPGKDAGAFAHPCVPSAHPYVLVNYQGKTRDVMTLAHELGHGVHQVLAAKQGYFNGSTPLTLAETASVFGEMLTFQSLLADASDARQRKVLLAGKVEDMLNTVVRQIAFHNFETHVHDARREKELLREDFQTAWMETQTEALGPAFNLKVEEYGDYWSYIPHFLHVPFYVYAYAFGDCLVNSLYAVYQDSEAGFAEKYLEMLASGGTKRHHELLAPFGLDAREPSFWRQGLTLLESFIDELETL